MKSEQQQIFNYFGLDTQIEKLFEEYREVLMAFLYGTDGDKKEEIADLGNIINQLIDHYGREEIEAIQKKKMERTLQRIDGGYYE